MAESVRTELLSVREAPGIRVTLVELGAVATAMTPADRLPFTAMAPDDVARVIRTEGWRARSLSSSWPV